MTQGPGRFEYYLIQLEEILRKASRSENPALYLYQNDARTKLFMLEGLTKLYEGLHDSKIFGKLKKQFKSLEDLIGEIDYYDAFSKDFLADPEMPATIRMFTEEKRENKFAELNHVLLKKKWINHDPLRTKKLRKKLGKPKWQKPEKEIEMIRSFYERSIKEINEFYANTGHRFTDIESQVHALRRKLRWLSIYPQALQGAIQLTDSAVPDVGVKKYLTPEIVNSSFNKMPEPGNNPAVLLFEKNYFLALSYMIAALGKLKDAGLRILATAEALQGTQFLSPEKALSRALELNKQGVEGLKDILDRSGRLCLPYFEERNIDKIVTMPVKETIAPPLFQPENAATEA